MIKFKLYSDSTRSNEYLKAKEQYDRRDDYAIANIAKENSKLPGQVAGATAGLVLGAVARKNIGKVMDSSPRLIRNIKKIDPGILELISSNASVVPAAIAGSHYGGEFTGNIARDRVLDEIRYIRDNNFYNEKKD